MKSFSIILIIFLAIYFAQTALAQKTFKLGFVRTFDDNGDSIWLANTKKKERIDSKAVARFGYGGLGKININERDTELKQFKDYLPDKNYKLGRGGYQFRKAKI